MQKNNTTYTPEQIDTIVKKICDKLGWENRGRVEVPPVKDKDKPLKG